MLSDNPLTVLSLTGLMAFSATSYFNYIVYRRLRDNGDTTIEYLLVRNKIKQAFELLITATLFFLASTLVTVAAVEIEMLVLSQSIRIGSALLFIAYTVFFATLAIYTRPEKLKNLR